MERSATSVLSEGLVEVSVDVWASEIRDYLLGRMSSRARIDDIEFPQPTDPANAPVRRWWIFEGKRYVSLGGSLAENWSTVISAARRLDETFNPRLRLSERPDGIVDWPNTLARGILRRPPEFVVRSAGIGLDDQERAALLGWAKWISAEWLQYNRSSDAQAPLEWHGLNLELGAEAEADQIVRWAHTARRSRWSLLRDVVSESFRPTLESEDLDRIPLPADSSALFELLCLVRIARFFAPCPHELRWLNLETSNNKLRVNGLQCHYQQSLDREEVLATSDYRGSLATAVNIFGVRIPEFIDLAFDFDKPRAGFDGLIVEVKSGSQQYDLTIPQLRTYRAARPRRPGSRFIVWGIVKTPNRTEAVSDDVIRALGVADNTDDVWLFSSADAISTVLQAIFGSAQ